MLRRIDTSEVAPVPNGFRAVCTVLVVTIPIKKLEEARVVSTHPCRRLQGDTYKVKCAGAENAQRFAQIEADGHNSMFQQPEEVNDPTHRLVHHVHNATVEPVF